MSNLFTGPNHFLPVLLFELKIFLYECKLTCHIEQYLKLHKYLLKEIKPTFCRYIPHTKERFNALQLQVHPFECTYLGLYTLPGHRPPTTVLQRLLSWAILSISPTAVPHFLYVCYEVASQGMCWTSSFPLALRISC